MLINEYLNKSNQNLVHYLSCQAITHTAYLNFCSGRVHKSLGLGLGAYGLGLEGCGLGLGLGLNILAFTTSPLICSSHILSVIH